ncbi:MAG: hypothetical protein EG823_01800 [Actinobacteria bacterium]|nr:hypothetical protein [Actinomycetota bacterium]
MAKPLKIVRLGRRAPGLAAFVTFMLLSTTVASSAPAPGKPESIVDNETVYVVADALGTPQTTVVVDWLQVQGTGLLALADPAGAAGEIESLSEGFTPAKSGDMVTASVEQDGYGDYFYRAETTAPLPFDVRVVYLLDGQETAPADLAGKDGRLRIEITIVNRLERTETVEYENADGALESSEVTYTVPILCIPQLEIDGTKMTDIVPPDGAQLAIAGSTLTYAIPVVPSPEETVAIEMTARDIELAPMIVSAFPGLPASPDFSVVDSFIEMRDGLSQLGLLSEGHLQLVQGIVGGMDEYDLSGMSGAAQGIAQLQTALAQMEGGATGLSQLAAGQYAYLDSVIAGIDTSQFDSLDELVAGITSMRQGAADLESGVSGLLGLVDGQIALAQQMDALNSASLADAQTLAGRYPADAEAQALAARLGQLDAMYDQLLGASAPGLPYLRAQLAGIGSGLTGLRQGLEAMEASAAGLSAVPGAFTQLRAALVVLRDGGDPDGAGPAPFMPGFGATKDGLTGLASGLTQAKTGFASSAGSLALLSEMPEMMGELKSTLQVLAAGGTLRGQQMPGISTTVDALDEVASGLGTGAEEMREGEALTNAMKAAAEEYTSFLGLPEGATGHLSFLYKVDGVSK